MRHSPPEELRPWGEDGGVGAGGGETSLFVWELASEPWLGELCSFAFV